MLASNFDVLDGLLYPADPSLWPIAVPLYRKRVMGESLLATFPKRNSMPHSEQSTGGSVREQISDDTAVCASRKGPGRVKLPPIPLILAVRSTWWGRLPTSMDGNQYAVLYGLFHQSLMAGGVCHT